MKEIVMQDVICVSWDRMPNAKKAKKLELMREGMSEDDAEKFLSEGIEMAAVYSTDFGLYLVEPDALDSALVTNPYNGNEVEPIENADTFPQEAGYEEFLGDV